MPLATRLTTPPIRYGPLPPDGAEPRRDENVAEGPDAPAAGQKRDAKRLGPALGEALVAMGCLTHEQLAEALELQKASKGARLGRILVQRGYATEYQVSEVLAEHLRIPCVDLSQVEIPADVIGLLPRDLARKHTCLPWLAEGRALYLLMGDPTDLGAMDAVAFRTGLKVLPVVAPESEVAAAIDRYYAEPRPEPEPSAPEASVLAGTTVELLAAESEEAPGAEADEGEEEKNANEAPTVTLVNAIMADAIQGGASDIHVEPRTRDVALRYRVDGLLRHVMTLPKRLQPKLLSRIKVISRLDISERRKPQDGRTFLRVSGKAYDLRVSTLPTAEGEKAVLRILAQDRARITLEGLGLDDQVLETWRALVERPQGLLLVTGPTGSGKTSTLYASLNFIRSETTNIVTVEDPVEYRLDGVNQVAVSEKAGMTFSAGLRSILRQDPDVIMVGEIRDAETARIAVQAAQTGHLVLSTLHTNDAPTAVTRLVDMGIPAYVVASSLLGILAQRLVRRLCDCRTPNPDGSASAHGCDRCRFSGYRGRIGVHELLRLTPRLRRALVDRASDDELRARAQDQGFVTMFQDGLRKAGRGLTTPDEVRRVVPPDESDEAETPSSRPEAQSPRGPRPADAPRRVLLVDDEPVTIRIVTAMLQEAGYSVVAASDGHSALSQLYNAPPDLLLTDLNMPGMDGAGLIRRLRGDLALSRIPVLLMTSEASGESAARDLGADGFIGKPVEQDVLLGLVRSAIVKSVLARSVTTTPVPALEADAAGASA